MALGQYLEIATVVEDIGAGLRFYRQLGFKQRGGDAVVTDGAINVRLVPAPAAPPLALRYADCNLAQFDTLALPTERDGDTVTLRDPNGVTVIATSRPSDHPMLTGKPLKRKPLSRCGKFGEFAVPVTDMDASLAWWQQLGYTQMHLADEPYPFAILSDDLFILGLHQTTDFSEPHITYFAGDMADRIATLGDQGFTLTPLPPEVDGRAANATFTGPGGEKFFLFHGEL